MDDYGFRTCRWPLKDAFQLMGIHVSDFHDSILPTMVGIFMTPVTRGAIRFPPGSPLNTHSETALIRYCCRHAANDGPQCLSHETSNGDG